jgi:tetratricopeptide (TPR) repeat protein
MRRLLLLAAIVLLTSAAARASAEGDDDASPSIARLIADLGDDNYAVRSRAEEQLLRMGPEAFDELSAAADSKDLEVAERVQYIIQRLQMQWVRRDDPPEVRRILARFGAESEDRRMQRVEELAKLKDGAGGAALCRIARFDASTIVSRHSATAILGLEMSADARRTLAEKWKAEFGKSDRPPVLWIELYLREVDDPQHAVADWAAANEAELKVYKDEKGVTDYLTVRALLNRHLEHCNELNLDNELAAALISCIELYHDANQPIGLDAGLGWAMRWIISHEKWKALTSLEDKYEHNFKQNRALLYYLAAAAASAGRSERATELAEQAFNLTHPSDEDSARRIFASEYAALSNLAWAERSDELAGAAESVRTAVASAVASLGHVDWAEREYRRVIEKNPIIDKNAMEARSDLAIWMHDREEYQAAADLLGEFCDAVDVDATARRALIAEIDDDPKFGGGRETVRGIEARRYFYLACVDEQRKDFEAQRTNLSRAADKFSQDPDILIALYRLPTGTDDERQAVTANIRRVASEMQEMIDDYPTAPGVYNQWAWLIANTEGDQQKAVEYSLKSLELAPEEPSYLDTLGRCYYAVGDYKNAVESQRKAVKLAPHYRVMQRQLALFEDALAKQSGG